MKHEHTPGPWTVSGYQPIYDVLAPDGMGKDCPCFVAREILIEDARLIAAAPDLLRALEWALENLAPPIHDGKDGGPQSLYAVRYEQARKALNKATRKG